MTKEDQIRFCIMLAFQSMVTQGKNINTKEVSEKIPSIAKLMSEFCDLQMTENFSGETIKLVDDKWAAEVDAAINQHIDELTKNEETRLPSERETLIHFYDRLQQRKMRREQWLFYANATEAQLSDKVLEYLDDEIADRQRAQ